MQVHLLITLPTSIVLDEATAPSFDLYTAPRLLLDVFHVLATLTYDLCAQVEAGDRLEVDGDALFRPLAASKGVALDLRLLGLLTTAEAALVDEVG